MTDGIFSLSEIFEIAVSLEVNGGRFYKNALAKVQKREVRELLVYLYQQEEEHQATFLRLKEESITDDRQISMPPTGFENLLKESMEGRLLSWDDHPGIDEDTTYHELLKAALDFERDASVFFSFLRELVDSPENRGAVDRIIQEEEEHIKRLSLLLPDQNT